MKTRTILITPGEEALWRLCEQVEYDVFQAEGYIAPNANKRIAQFDGYRHSRFVGVFRCNGAGPGFPDFDDVAGVMRYVHIPNETKMQKGLLPTIDAAGELKIPSKILNRLMSLEPQACIDLTSTAIPPKYRATETIWAFMEFFTKHLPEVQYLLAALDVRVYKAARQYFVKLKELGPPVYYWGSLTTAVLLDRYDFSFK